jgi:HIV Tat-specific factor 1
MFEIINSVVKELTLMKQMQTVNNFHAPIPNISLTSVTPQQQYFTRSFVEMNTNKKIDVSDEEDEDEDEDEDDDEEEDEEFNKDTEEAVDLIEENITLEAVEESSESIKVINVDINDTINADDLIETVEIDSDDAISDENNAPVVELQEEEPIHVEKIESEDVSNLENNSVEDVVSTDGTKEVYSKMTVQELKALVITKGLRSDPSKLKKNDLIKLLEATNE